MKVMQIQFFVLVFFILFTSMAFGDVSPEFRGVWVDVRSIPTTRSEINSIVERLARANFNAILLESFYLGQTIYPSEVMASRGLTRQMATFAQAGFDPLSAFIKSAHQHSMQVHVWFDMFYVGLNQPGKLLEKYPSWLAVNRDGTVGYTQGKNRFYWVCPMHEGVQEFYTELITEAIRKYDLDGVHLDYMRFPDPTLADTCYATEHRDSFRTNHGIDPTELDPLAQPEAYRAWNEKRAQSVTNLLAVITNQVHHQQPDCIVSVAVMPRGMPVELNPGFLQDWPHWAENHLLDVVIPMTYSSRVNEMKGFTVWVNTFILRNLPVYAGLQGFNLSDTASLVQQVEIARKAGFQGVAIFAYPYLNDDMLTVLKNGPFHQPTAAPDRKFLASMVPSEKAKVVRFTHSEPRIIKAIFSQEEIQIDGLLNENSWKNVGYQSGFFLITGEGLATAQTKIAALYTPTHLNLAFIVKNSPFKTRKATIIQKDGPVFYDDSVEVFLDPWMSRSFYYHLAMNSLGTQYDSFSRTGPTWNANWAVGVSETDNQWIAEISIPFSELNINSPHPGDQWGVNFNRTDINTGEFSGWSPTPGTFHAPSFFGILEFGNH